MILAWLTQASPEGAATWFTRLIEVLKQLAETPTNCDLAPENEEHDEDIRQVIFKTRRGRRYRALFIIRENTVFVLDVRGPG